MEDISVRGYEMTEKCLDFDGAKLVALRLAKFHAASIYLQANVSFVSRYVSAFV